jgi:hypothetical protein
MRRVVASLILGIGLLAGTLAMSGWWFRATTLDPTRTDRVANTVLESPEVRTAVGNAIGDAVAAESGQDPATVRALVDKSINELPDLSFLADLVGKAHQAALGVGPSKIVLDTTVLTPLVGADLAAQANNVAFTVPTVRPLAEARKRLDPILLDVGAVALACIAAAFILHPRRPVVFRRVGFWLLGLSLWELMATWVFPAVVVPTITKNPWAQLAARTTVASSKDLIPVLAGLAVAGVASLVASVAWASYADRSPSVVHPTGQPVVGSAAWSAWAAQNAANTQQRLSGNQAPASGQQATFSASHRRPNSDTSDGWKL